MTLRRKLLWLGGVAAFLFFTTLLFAAKWISNKFGGVTAEQIAYHMVAPMSGVDPRFIYSFLKLLAGSFALTVLYGYFLRRTVRGDATWRLSRRAMGWILGMALAAVAGVSLGYVETRYGIAGFFNPRYYMSGEESTFFEENFRFVSAEDVTFPNGKNNLIFLVLESIEDTVNREDLFGEKLMPGLDRLARENVSFAKHRQCYGTGWSVAGICAYFMGVPLLTPKGLQKFYGEVAREFLPGAPSILSVLERHGYDVDFMIGVDARFGGHDKVFVSHLSNHEVIDIRDFRRIRSDIEGNLNDWGLTDSYLFDRAKEHLQRTAGNEPFALVIETMNTHIPGYPSPQAARRWNDYRDCFPEVDGIVVDFLDWVRAQDFADNTTIVLVGDHLAMTYSLGAVELPPYNDRSVFNLFINSRKQPERDSAERFFASWDIAPSVLESLGAELPDGRFGLGASLFGREPTLLEKHGYDKYENEIVNYSKLYTSFFQRGPEADRLARKR